MRISASRLRSIRPAPSRSSTAIAVCTLGEDAAQALPPEAGRRSAGAVAQRLGEVEAQRLERGREAEEKRRREREHRREERACRRRSRSARAPAGRRSPRDARTRMPAQASARPSAAPAAASTRLSVRSWRVSRPWPAPIEARTAISRCRPSARESSRFATLAQAMSIRNPTAPKTRTRARRAPPRISSSTRHGEGVEAHVLRIHALLGQRRRDELQLRARALRRRAPGLSFAAP